MKRKNKANFLRIFLLVFLMIGWGCSDPTTQVSKLEKPLSPVDEELLKYASLGDLKGVRSAIERGADTLVTDTPRWTALHHASRWNRIEIVRYLIEEHSLDPKARNQFGQNSLHFAVWAGSLELTKYFIEEQGIPANIEDFFGATPLHMCSWSASVEIARYLLEEKGAKVNYLDENKRSALHWASERFRLDIPEEKSLDLVRYLVEEQSARIDIKDVLGKVPRDLARDSFQNQIKNYLKKREQLQ